MFFSPLFVACSDARNIQMRVFIHRSFVLFVSWQSAPFGADKELSNTDPETRGDRPENEIEQLVQAVAERKPWPPD